MNDQVWDPASQDIRQEHMEMANKIKGEFDICPDHASITATERQYLSQMVDWRDNGTPYQKVMVIQIRNLILLKRKTLGPRR